MTHMLHTVLEKTRWDWLMRHHPCLAAVLLLVGLPLGVLLVVSLLTMALSWPLAFLLGWL